MNNALQGHRVLITGGADGIGLGIADRFAAAGAEVIVCDLRQEAVQAVRQSRPAYHAYQADVSDADGIIELVKSATEEHGPLDTLVNNVGIAGPHAYVEDIDVEDWEQSLRANTSGMFYAIKAAVPEMKKRGSGSIINISSVGTATLPPRRAAYNTSKWAVEGLTRSLSRELGAFNIRCNAILPGVMGNERMERIMRRRAEAENRTFEDVRNEYLQCSAMGKLIDVEDIGEMAVFLASPKSRYVTGQLIAVCGGIQWEN